MSRQRRHFTPEQKVPFSGHLLEKVPVSDLCQQHASPLKHANDPKANFQFTLNQYRIRSQSGNDCII